ncbi:MAG: hypothetical protein L6Q97_13320, partial [Thermoanaerobaculia bacterium]|nr:hypothetical protein [Thermoanaerobaculia bacterium]
VYTVSVISEKSWTAPMNKTGSAQIILRVPAGVAFVPAITSRIEGLVWADNAYIENLQQAPGYTFVAIAMVNGPTDKINFSEGEVTPLFDFVNAAGECPGLVELTSNDDPLIRSVVAEGFNVTQHIAVLGARGNAYAGIATGAVDCGLVSGAPDNTGSDIENIKVAPLPADEQVTVTWNRVSDATRDVEMAIHNISGQLIWLQSIPAGKGEFTQNIMVKDWKPGLYHLVFQSADGRHSVPHNLLIVH